MSRALDTSTVLWRNRTQGSSYRYADFSFFHTSDLHYGQGAEQNTKNLATVNAMNALPGTALPAAIGGYVDVPSFVVCTGDLIHLSTSYSVQWPLFEADYGLTGKDGVLRYPVNEMLGNHDIPGVDMPGQMRWRHGGTEYGWWWEGIRFLACGEVPRGGVLTWLAAELANIGTATPVVVLIHYTLESYSIPTDWSQVEADLFGDELEGYNVIGILHGHDHVSQKYTFEGHNVYDAGSWGNESFLMYLVRGDVLWVVERDVALASWGWSHQSTISYPLAV